jgi:hypothetical protein
MRNAIVNLPVPIRWAMFVVLWFVVMPTLAFVWLPGCWGFMEDLQP